jgi:hypothetical protein
MARLTWGDVALAGGKTKNRDDLSGLQKKLEGELRTRANSRASIRFEMDALRSQLAAFQEVSPTLRHPRVCGVCVCRVVSCACACVRVR